jgi:hypothetical protein
MAEKYHKKMCNFIERCEMAEELDDLVKEKEHADGNAKKWPSFKEKHLQQLGEKYDEILAESVSEIANGFSVYLK